MGLLGVLAVVFIVLKLLHVIAWSWWLVLLLIWGGFVLWLLVGVVIGLVAAAIERPRRRR